MGSKQKGRRSDVLGAKPLNLAKVVGATVLEAKNSSNGKPGFFGQGAIMVRCSDTSYKFQLGINLTAIDNDKQQLDQETRQAIRASQPMLADTILKGRMAEPRQFKTGSVGFYHGDKVQLEVNGKPVTFQLGVLLTAHGSKEWEAEAPKAEDKGEQPAAE
jgi:hypothetical protein